MIDWKDSLASLLTEDEKTEIANRPAEEPKPMVQKKPVLRLVLDKRKGKTATLILGMEEQEDSTVEALAKQLKSRLAVGGSVRDGEILLQGDIREKAKGLLLELGYRIKG